MQTDSKYSTSDNEIAIICYNESSRLNRVIDRFVHVANQCTYKVAPTCIPISKASFRIESIWQLYFKSSALDSPLQT
jgi:hypothetical protein